MIASSERLFGKPVAVEISTDEHSESGDCTMWLSYEPKRASALLVFGITPNGDSITWTARVHVNGQPVTARAGEITRPDAAAEIFAIAREFVRAFARAAGI
jgi:hypothetical protein